MNDNNGNSNGNRPPKPSRRICSLVKRALREKARGARHYELASVAIKMAMTAGLQPRQQVEIETLDDDGKLLKEVYELVDNFTGQDKAFAGAYAKHYELKPVPKSRQQKPEPAAAAVPAAAEVAS